VRQSLFLDIAVAGDRVVAIGERGHVLVSDDAGRSWMQVAVPTRRALTGLAAVDGTHLWAVGHDAIILHSGDGGSSWVCQLEAPEEEAPLLDVWFADRRRGIAYGAYGLWFETTDGGRSWTRGALGDEDFHIYALAASPAGHLFVAGEFGSILRSTDNGQTWKSLSSPYEGTFFGLEVLSERSLLVFGLRGHLFRTDDGGVSWRRIETATEASLLSSLRMADGSILIVGLAGAMLQSRDGGQTFHAVSGGGSAGIAAAVEIDADHLLLAGEGGIHRVAMPGGR
ncbi:MAG: YCF48-related protein, partial [Candidatus Eiseniibacteriota bacterium]